MSTLDVESANLLNGSKFKDPDVTADGSMRAAVSLRRLQTLWFNTGTLCNLTCADCYIESSPSNDRLVYLTRDEVRKYLTEIEDWSPAVREIGFTGGEPFMNPDIIGMIEDSLENGHAVLVLTNAMRPMMKCADGLADLNTRWPGRLTIRVSLDHYTRPLHELARGAHSWDPAWIGLRWLRDEGFTVDIAGRTCWSESEAQLRAEFGRLFAAEKLTVDARDAARLVLFPEMDADADTPEITTACWDILNVEPAAMMCASSRMIIKRKGAATPVVAPCTLLPYEEGLEMGVTLKEASGAVKLNHPHCSAFCVLGGGSCSQ
ncbi:MAG: radical SAM protein [Alphaproteobacteria bacterium]|jgi:sulfatase maturation enzyme AslB (radical SAM superfamily)